MKKTVKKLYGREKELVELRHQCSIARTGDFRTVLIDGVSGIGKTALIERFIKLEGKSKLLYGYGKYNNINNEVPYAGLKLALKGIVEQILAFNEAEFESTKKSLLNTAGNILGTLLPLIPELESITGTLPTQPEVPESDANARLATAFQRLIASLAKKELPLCLILDDVQWMDSSSMKLISGMVNNSSLTNLFLIFSYRREEINSSGSHLLELLNSTGKEATTTIYVEPLSENSILAMASDLLMCKDEDRKNIAALLKEKTEGNPFYLNEFLSDFARDETFIDISKIKNAPSTENIALMMSKAFNRLPKEIKDLLHKASCIGNDFELKILSELSGCSIETIMEQFETLTERGVLALQDGVGHFTHDKILEAAYVLERDDIRDAIHLSLGRIFLGNDSEHGVDESLFTAARHYSKAMHLLNSREELISTTQLFLKVGEMSRQQKAYGLGSEFLVLAEQVAPTDWLEGNLNLIFNLYINKLECLHMLGDFDGAEETFQLLNLIELDNTQKMHVFSIRMSQICSSDPSGIFLGLAHSFMSDIFETNLPKKKEQQEKLSAELLAEVIPAVLGGELEPLNDMPVDTSDERNGLDSSLYYILTGMYNHNPTFYPAAICECIKYTIKHGPSEFSGVILIGFAIILVATENYVAARKVQLLSERLNAKGKRIYINQISDIIALLYISPWVTEQRKSFDDYNQSSESAAALGNQLQTEYIHAHFGGLAIFGGWKICDVINSIDSQKKQFNNSSTSPYIHTFGVLNRLIFELLERDANKNFENNYLFSEEMENLVSQHNLSLLGDAYLRIFRATACIYFRRYGRAADYLFNPSVILQIIPAQIIGNEAQFFYAIAVSQSIDVVTSDDSMPSELLVLEKRFSSLTDLCGENFLARYLIIKAEIERINGNYNEALELFTAAAESANNSGMHNIEGLAQELAFNLQYKSRKFKDAAIVLEKACKAYKAWGAYAKVDALVDEFGELLNSKAGLQQQEKIEEHRFSESNGYQQVLDAAITVSQATGRDKVIHTLLESVQRTTGASTVYMVDVDDEALKVVGYCSTSDGKPVATMESDLETDGKTILPSLIAVAKRSNDVVVIDDTTANHLTANDIGNLRHNPKSILVIPVAHGNIPRSFLYLENTLVTDFFDAIKVDITRNISTLSAGILENATLHDQLVNEISEKEKAKKEQAKYASKLVDIQETERKSIAYELHDSIGQNLLVSLNNISMVTKLNTDEETIPIMEDTRKIVKETIGQVKNIAYLLRPPQLDLLGLKGSILSLINRVEKSSPINFHFQSNIESLRFESKVETGLFRIVQEAINNVIKHSGATECTILLEHDSKSNRLSVTISDDGRGIENISDDSGSVQKGIGMHSMQERTSSLEGNFNISQLLAEGVVIRVNIPLT